MRANNNALVEAFTKHPPTCLCGEKKPTSAGEQPRMAFFSDDYVRRRRLLRNRPNVVIHAWSKRTSGKWKIEGKEELLLLLMLIAPALADPVLQHWACRPRPTELKDRARGRRGIRGGVLM